MEVKKSSWHYQLADWSTFFDPYTYEPTKTRLSYYRDVLRGCFNLALFIILFCLVIFVCCLMVGAIPAMILKVESIVLLLLMGASIIAFGLGIYFIVYRVIYSCKWLQEKVKIIE